MSRVALITALALLAGCTRLGFKPHGPGGDGRSLDAALPEVGVTDARSGADAADGRAPDLPARDGEPADGATLDLKAPDGTPPPDVKLPDAPPPLDVVIPDAFALACAAPAAPKIVFAPDMVICGTTGGIYEDQCGADKWCNKLDGWHMCSAAEFRARGGEVQAAPFSAWIASCVRASGVVSSPTNAACQSCKLEADSNVPLSWDCATGAAYSSTSRHSGVCTFPYCRRLGVSQPTTEAYWTTVPTAMSLASAVCCK